MTKTVLKETIIILLICVVILLILGVIFYDFNPLNKVIPNKISYSTDKEIKEQIEEDQTGNILTDGYNQMYSIDNADLDKYKKSDRYVAGKEHPFSDLAETPSQYADPSQGTASSGNGEGASGQNINAEIKQAPATTIMPTGQDTNSVENTLNTPRKK